VTRGARLSLLALSATAAALTACAHRGPVGTVRFENQPPVTRVNDRKDVPDEPANHPFPEKLYFFDAVFYDRVDNYMELEEPRRALNVNSLDEVPDSTWFTNRIGARDVTPEELRLGPNEFAGPDLSQQLTVTGSKVGGGSAGFVIQDARGDRYIIKFDEPHAPITESATDVAVQRLLWACGYNVPENGIIYFQRDDLVLADGAAVKDVFGNKRPMTEADIDEELAGSYCSKDGEYRALASKLLPGVPIGGFVQEGVRADDPNDTIPHEHRREVRGLYLIFGWVQQTDAKEDNTLDMWVEGTDGRHYVRHYLVDFGKSFGTSGLVVKRPGDGHVENVDFEYILRSLPALGLWKRPYEGTRTPGIQGLGMFDAEHFSPGQWKSHAPYRPFDFVDAYDLYWAAKILVEFTTEHIRIAIEQGRFEDPRAVDYLVETMVARQRKAVKFAFEQVNPLDDFVLTRTADGYQLCFDDLLVKHALSPGTGAVSRYAATTYDYAGVPTGWSAAADAGDAQTACVQGLVPSGGTDNYTIVRMDTMRIDQRLKPVEVHLATDPATGELRIIGLNRR